MNRDRTVDFKETIELFLIDTIYEIDSQKTIPKFYISFPKSAYDLFEYVMENPFQKEDAWTPNITPKDLEKLQNLDCYDNNTPHIVVHDPVMFFTYLTNITNNLIKTYEKYDETISARALCIKVLRNIWLRMSAIDFNQVEFFLKNQLEFSKLNILDNLDIIKPFTNFNNYHLRIKTKLYFNTYYESSRFMSFEIYKDNTAIYTLPNITYAIMNDGIQEVCYIYCIQHDRKRKKDKQLQRLLYKINEGILETESQEYFAYLNKVSTYYPENIIDLNPGHVVSLLYFINLLKEKNITKIKVPIFQILSYDYHVILGQLAKEKFSKKWTEATFKNLEYLSFQDKEYALEEYEWDKEWYNRLVDKEDDISKTMIENLIRLFNRISYHCPEIEILNEPMLQGDYLDIKIKKRK